MKTFLLPFPTLALRCFPMVLLAALSPLKAAPETAVALFNGKDLSGWAVPSPNPFWSVKDGVLTGTNDPAKQGSMLYTLKSYGDFELEAEARWTGDIDSGFMLRKPELQVQLGVSRSLKIDMTGCFYTGTYPKEGQATERAKLLKPNEWNHFRIRARGDTFTVWINGTEAVSYQDAKYADPGPVGLQIHGGLDMTVQFRNLQISAEK